MKLWLLRPVEGLELSDNPWEPWYDKAFGFVVRAATEEEARGMVRDQIGDEGRDEEYRETNVWANPKYATCVELTAEGEPGVIIRDFASA